MFKIYHNSGKDYNDFGRFEECESMPDFNYILGVVNTGKKLANPLSWGLCMPIVCKDFDLNEYKSYIVETINK